MYMVRLIGILEHWQEELWITTIVVLGIFLVVYAAVVLRNEHRKLEQQKGDKKI